MISTYKLTKENALPVYLDYLMTQRGHIPEVVRKNQAFLLKVEAELGKSPLDVERGSEIERAIICAAAKRKMDYNGGHMDNGEGMRFRLGQAVSCFLRWAYRERLIDRNPYEANTFREPKSHEAPHLSEDTARKLYHSKELCLKDQLIVCFLLDTGLRVSEFCRVKMKDIDLKDMTVVVHMTKVGRFKRAPFTERTRDLIIKWRNERSQKSEYLFPNPSKEQITPKSITLRLRNVSKEVGYRVSPHMLRHTAATMWARGGAQQVAIMEFLGHTSAEMTKHYLHITGQDLKKVQKATFEKCMFVAAPPNYIAKNN